MKNFYKLLCAVLFLSFSISDNVSAQSFNTGKIGVTLSNAGRIRIYKADDETRMTDRISILVGGKTNEIFSYNADSDSAAGSGGSKDVENPSLSNFEVTTTVDNLYGAHQDPPEPTYPPNVQAQINVFGWTDTNFLIFKVSVKNMETAILDAKFGLEIIPQIDGNYGFETTKYFSDTKAFAIFTSDTSARIGFKMLSENFTSLKTIDWFDNYDSTDVNLQGWFSPGTMESEYVCNSSDGTVTFCSVNASAIASSAAKDYYFAIAIGQSDSEMLAGIADAAAKYAASFTSVVKTDEVPSEFALSQNYPNPFNPSTKINFSLPARDHITLRVYNSIGQQVAELLNSSMEAGSYSIDFNAGNLTSGVYVYTLNSGALNISRKMILVK